MIACEKTQQAERMPTGSARNELLSSANMLRRLRELRGQFEAEKRNMH
jgi:hypothetical protein